MKQALIQVTVLRKIMPEYFDEYICHLHRNIAEKALPLKLFHGPVARSCDQACETSCCVTQG